jgi:hypothetical protein
MPSALVRRAFGKVVDRHGNPQHVPNRLKSTAAPRASGGRRLVREDRAAKQARSPITPASGAGPTRGLLRLEISFMTPSARVRRRFRKMATGRKANLVGNTRSDIWTTTRRQRRNRPSPSRSPPSHQSEIDGEIHRGGMWDEVRAEFTVVLLANVSDEDVVKLRKGTNLRLSFRMIRSWRIELSEFGGLPTCVGQA